MLQTMTVHKSNWTGEMGKVEYNSLTGHFTIEDIDQVFRIDTPVGDEPGLYRVRNNDGQRWFGHRCGQNVIFAASGIQREADSAYVAFAQLAWNII